MDIAFVSNVVYPYVTGGAQKRIHEIGRRLVDRGHEVVVYGRHYWDGPPKTTNEGMCLRAVAPSRKLYVDDDGRRSITEAIDFAARLTPRLARRLGDHDLVVVSVFPYFPVIASALTGYLRNTPVVTTWHEVWLDYWNEYLGTLAIGGKLTERLTAAVPQHPIAVSEHTATELAGLGVARDDITVVPNGIDYDHVRSVTPATDGYDVLSVGRLTREKRVDVLLRAFDRVADDLDLRLGVIGDGPRAEPLRSLTADLDASDRIEFLGFLEDHDDVLAQLRSADVFALPSTREGFGITAVEAMAAGCSVVVAQHPNSAASSVVGDAGIGTQPTVDTFAHALRRLLTGDANTASPVDRARQFDWDTVADTALTAYRAAHHATDQ